jgi:hypothetical protein
LFERNLGIWLQIAYLQKCAVDGSKVNMRCSQYDTVNMLVK